MRITEIRDEWKRRRFLDYLGIQWLFGVVWKFSLNEIKVIKWPKNWFYFKKLQNWEK